jgi:regulator of protease activity HflC (stomatin/prohibitin superfamily)
LGTGLLVAAAIVVIVLFALVRTVRIVPPGHNAVISRLGRYSRTAEAGLTVLVPFADQVTAMVDMREQRLAFAPQPVRTADEFDVTIFPAVTLQVTDARAATFEIADYARAVEQLTATALRGVVGGLRREQVRSSRAWITTQVRPVLDDAIGRWGLRLGAVEIELSR